jgi:periplasmic protein TonB
MAYTDELSRRPHPGGIGGALAITSLMVAGIIFAAPEILPEEWTTLETYPVTAPPPAPKLDIRRDKPAEKASAQSYAPPKPNAAQPQPSDGLVPQPGAGLIPPSAGSGLVDPPQQPPQHSPVLIGARIDPRYASALQPAYPPGMIREGREGVVVLRVLIGVDGRVKAIEPIASDGDAFLAATRKQALGKWRFLPATRDGEAVEGWREMTVRFRLPD